MNQIVVSFFLDTVDITRFGEERLINIINEETSFHFVSFNESNKEFDRMIELNEHVKDDLSYNMVNSVLARKLKEDTSRSIYDEETGSILFGVSYDEEDIELAKDHGFEEIAHILGRELSR